MAIHLSGSGRRLWRVSGRELSEMAVSGEKRAPGAHVLVGEPTAVPRWIAWKVWQEDASPLVPFNNINSEMAMEANTYESHDSVQALADVGLTLALSKGRGNANTKKDGLEIARAAARAPSTRRAAPPAEDAHRAYRIRSMGGLPLDGGSQKEWWSSVRCRWRLSWCRGWSVMPSPPKPKVRSTAGKVQPAHRAAHEKGPDTEAPSPNRSQPVLAVVAFAMDDITTLARFNLFDVHLGNVLERIA